MPQPDTETHRFLSSIRKGQVNQEHIPDWLPDVVASEAYMVHVFSDAKKMTALVSAWMQQVHKECKTYEAVYHHLPPDLHMSRKHVFGIDRWLQLQVNMLVILRQNVDERAHKGALAIVKTLCDPSAIDGVIGVVILCNRDGRQPDDDHSAIISVSRARFGFYEEEMNFALEVNNQADADVRQAYCMQFPFAQAFAVSWTT